MYRCDNDSVVPVEYNCSTAVPVCGRAGEVIVSLADDSSCCPRKLCGEAAANWWSLTSRNVCGGADDVTCDSSAVCNQSLCDLLPPECKYGEKLVSYYRRDSCCPDHVCGEVPLTIIDWGSAGTKGAFSTPLTVMEALELKIQLMDATRRV